MTHGHSTWRALGMAFLGSLAICADANERPPTFRVTHVELSGDGRLDDRIVRECDVSRIVTDAIERYRSKAAPTDLSLRVDRVARVGGGKGNPGGTDLGITLLAADGQEMNQAFACRAERFASIRNPSHCQRIDWCGGKIAEQISTWLSWKATH